MKRWAALVSVFLFANVVVFAAAPGQRGNREGSSPQRGQRGDAQNPELRAAREALQRDIAEGKRLQEQLKRDRQVGDREAITRDQDALKTNRDAVKRDQERIRQLTNGRGRGRGRDGVAVANI
jgi:hypothetical protein